MFLYSPAFPAIFCLHFSLLTFHFLLLTYSPYHSGRRSFSKSLYGLMRLSRAWATSISYVNNSGSFDDARCKICPFGATISLRPMNDNAGFSPRCSRPTRLAVMANTWFSKHRVTMASGQWGSTKLLGWQRISAPLSAKVLAASG